LFALGKKNIAKYYKINGITKGKRLIVNAVEIKSFHSILTKDFSE
jgi:hypothetical protein